MSNVDADALSSFFLVNTRCDVAMKETLRALQNENRKKLKITAKIKTCQI